jgi:hypothetical protein
MADERAFAERRALAKRTDRAQADADHWLLRLKGSE